MNAETMGIYETDGIHTLTKAVAPAGGASLIREEVSTLQAHGKGRGYRVDAEAAAGGHLVPVAFAQNQRGELRESDVSPQLTTGGGKPGEGYPAVRLAPSLTAANDPSRSPQSSEVTRQVDAVRRETGQVRRLTPVECERLMSWPDGWTAVDGDATPDGRRYAACGDGVVSNVAEWIARRILAVDAELA